MSIILNVLLLSSMIQKVHLIVGKKGPKCTGERVGECMAHLADTSVSLDVDDDAFGDDNITAIFDALCRYTELYKTIVDIYFHIHIFSDKPIYPFQRGTDFRRQNQ